LTIRCLLPSLGISRCTRVHRSLFLLGILFAFSWDMVFNLTVSSVESTVFYYLFFLFPSASSSLHARWLPSVFTWPYCRFALTRRLKPFLSSRRVPYSVFKVRSLVNFLKPDIPVGKIDKILTWGITIGFFVARLSSSRHSDDIVTIHPHSIMIVPVLSSVFDPSY
jgi:hypothetical protein